MISCDKLWGCGGGIALQRISSIHWALYIYEFIWFSPGGSLNSTCQRKRAISSIEVWIRRPTHPLRKHQEELCLFKNKSPLAHKTLNLGQDKWHFVVYNQCCISKGLGARIIQALGIEDSAYVILLTTKSHHIQSHIIYRRFDWWLRRC